MSNDPHSQQPAALWLAQQPAALWLDSITEPCPDPLESGQEPDPPVPSSGQQPDMSLMPTAPAIMPDCTPESDHADDDVAAPAPRPMPADSSGQEPDLPSGQEPDTPISGQEPDLPSGQEPDTPMTCDDIVQILRAKNVRELKGLAGGQGVDTRMCIEKEDLVMQLVDVLGSSALEEVPPPPSGSPLPEREEPPAPPPPPPPPPPLTPPPPAAASSSASGLQSPIDLGVGPIQTPYSYYAGADDAGRGYTQASASDMHSWTWRGGKMQGPYPDGKWALELRCYTPGCPSNWVIEDYDSNQAYVTAKELGWWRPSTKPWSRARCFVCSTLP